MDAAIITSLETLIPEEEGFSETPYWDIRQWTWGYGTAAGFNERVKPSGSITREKAMTDLIADFTKDYYLLAPKVTINLNANQWCAFLDFSFNEGIGNAENLLNDINSNSPNLEHHIKEYIYAGGVINSDLVVRRNKEWVIWNTPVT